MNRPRLSFSARIVLAAAAFLQVSCGSSDSTLSGTATFRQPTFVVMGGNETCVRGTGTNRYEPRNIQFAPLAEKLISDLREARQVETRVIYSCYDSTATIYYAIDNELSVRDGTREDFFQDIRQATDDDGLVVLIGHSYGGWLGMKLAHDFAKLDFKVGGIFTIDPISRVDCSFATPFGCTSAPKDIVASEKAMIQNSSDHWANYFQTRTGYLHSSAMSQADENLQINASHTKIDNDQNVWADITTNVQLLQ